MIVAISGAGGFIGQALVHKFSRMEWTIRTLDRATFTLSDEEFATRFFEGTDVVINLAGAPVSKRWTPEYKKEILDSRILTTRKIVSAIGRAVRKPRLFLSASAIGIYPSEGTHTESSMEVSPLYLAQVCHQWEEEARKAEPACRVVLGRLGVVLGRDGGALQAMQFPFSIGLGGKIGNGRQPMSFIHLDDLTEAFLFLIQHEELSGPVNLVAPYPTVNAEFSETLGKVMTQPTWLTIPSFALKLLYGEGAQVLLEGQRVLPDKLTGAGFRFRYPTVQNALMEVYR